MLQFNKWLLGLITFLAVVIPASVMGQDVNHYRADFPLYTYAEKGEVPGYLGEYTALITETINSPLPVTVQHQTYAVRDDGFTEWYCETAVSVDLATLEMQIYAYYGKPAAQKLLAKSTYTVTGEYRVRQSLADEHQQCTHDLTNDLLTKELPLRRVFRSSWSQLGSRTGTRLQGVAPRPGFRDFLLTVSLQDDLELDDAPTIKLVRTAKGYIVDQLTIDRIVPYEIDADLLSLHEDDNDYSGAGLREAYNKAKLKQMLENPR